jgi:hypothetical protein
MKWTWGYLIGLVVVEVPVFFSACSSGVVNETENLLVCLFVARIAYIVSVRQRDLVQLLYLMILKPAFKNI